MGEDFIKGECPFAIGMRDKTGTEKYSHCPSTDILVAIQHQNLMKSSPPAKLPPLERLAANLNSEHIDDFV